MSNSQENVNIQANRNNRSQRVSILHVKNNNSGQMNYSTEQSTDQLANLADSAPTSGQVALKAIEAK